MKRTYILLKDLPDVKAGAEFTLSKDEDAYGYIADAKQYAQYMSYFYPKLFVENNTEWFRLKVNIPRVFTGIKIATPGNCSSNYGQIYIECEDGLFRCKDFPERPFTLEEMRGDRNRGHLKELK